MFDEKTMECLFQTPLVAQAVVDGDGVIRRCNPAFARFCRHPQHQLEGQSLLALLTGESRLPVNGGTTRLVFRGGDGRRLWGDACLIPLPAGDAALLQINDRSREHREGQLCKGRTRVLELLYGDHSLAEICTEIARHVEEIDPEMRSSILILDAERGTLHVAAAPSLPEFYSTAIDGMLIGDGVGSCGTAVFRRERVIVSDILSHPYWARARRLVQRTSLRACWSEPIVTHDGNVLGSFALYYDQPREPLPEELDLITSVASLAAIAISCKRAEEALRNLDRVKDEFISTAAHELRTPLTAILGFSELLTSGDYPEPRQREFATEIQRRGMLLDRLVDDLFDVSLIQLGRPLALHPETVVLRPLLDSVLDEFRQSSAGHHFELSCGNDVPPEICCDSQRLIQVLTNLLENAVKYSPQGGTVRIEVHAGEGAVVFQISDNGIGMSSAELSRAFDNFYRANNSSIAPGGLGLGLGIVRQIVEGHGGQIKLKSRPGEGTLVTFTLPC
jgi:signal transduction histidine kinase